MKNGAQLEAFALELLRGVPGVRSVDTEVPTGNDRRMNGVVQFSDRRAPVVFDVKTHVNAATAWQLINTAPRDDGDPHGFVIIARSTTAEARALLTAHGIGVIDGLGNAHVELPGLLIHLQQTRRKTAHPSHRAAPRLTGKAGVIAQALLLEPERTWKIIDVADVASASAGLAHRVLARLEAEHVLTAEGAGPQRHRRVVDSTALFDLWAEEAATERPHRTAAHLLARTPDARTRALARNLDSAGIPYAITGAAAAAMLAPSVTAIPTTEVWLPAKSLQSDIFAATGAEPVEEGANVMLLQMTGDAPLAFARRHQDVTITNMFRLYVDLRRDPRRGREQADNLRQEVIGF